MALKQTHQLKLLQKLSPQQIQLMKLLQLPTLALEQRIKEELEANPALEEGNEEELEQQEDFEDDLLNESDDVEEQNDDDAVMEDAQRMDDEISIDDFMDEEEVADYKYEINNSGKDNDFHETPITKLPGVSFKP
jgi:RNA polymerase sigma-54 factor